MACLPKVPVVRKFLIVSGQFWPGDPVAALAALRAVQTQAFQHNG
jgi:hypothetical protein